MRARRQHLYVLLKVAFAMANGSATVAFEGRQHLLDNPPALTA